jgi:type I restriction-modification system DNA methylase subunit
MLSHGTHGKREHSLIDASNAQMALPSSFGSNSSLNRSAMLNEDVWRISDTVNQKRHAHATLLENVSND